MSRRPRVLLFRREVPTGGGPESLIIDIARFICRDRFDLSVATFAAPGVAEPDTPLHRQVRALGIVTHAVPARHAWDPTCVGALRRLLDRLEIDLLHSHDHRTNLIALLAARRRSTRLIATMHQPLRRHWWLRHWEIVDERVLRRFDRVLPVAEAIRREFVQRYPQLAARAVTVLNGVDVSRFQTPADAAAIRHEFGLPPDALLCLNIGRFQADKDLACLIQAARLVAPKRPDIRWLLAGRGPLEGELRALVRRHRLEDRVLFAGFRTDVPALLAAADVFVVSSVSEGLSVAILEAMSAGRAIIATSVGGTPEAIEHERTGLLIQPRSPQELADAVVRLADDAPLRAELAARARQRAADRFSVASMVRQIEEVYESLVCVGPAQT